MSTRYLEILAAQRPFPAYVDENGRVAFSINFECEAAAPVGDFEREIVKLLSNAGLATLGTDTFIGPDAVFPDGDGPFISLTDTGGSSPIETHDEQKYERLSIQVVVRAEDYEAARGRALAIWRELDGKRNVTVAA